MKTPDSVDATGSVRGRACPLCENGAMLDYMRFLDPHGRERVDEEVFECGPQRHTYHWNGTKLRLLAADGKRPESPVHFDLTPLR